MTDENGKEQINEKANEPHEKEQKGNEQSEEQWFLIEHEPKECGSVIIINVTKFIDAYGKAKG